MATTFFEASQAACQEITKTFDMVWALDAGLWNLRQAATEFFSNNADANNKDAKDAIVNGLYVHGLNLNRVAYGYTWEQEEEFISEVLLINATAIFDAWVDRFVYDSLTMPSNGKKGEIAKNMKQGEFLSYETALNNETSSQVKGCFKIGAHTAYCDKQRLIYKYFKSCRNCLAHGDKVFSNAAAEKYTAISALTGNDCGLKEFPQMVNTIKDKPFQLKLRGVVGFYDILIRVITHYDRMAAEKKGVDNELIKRWRKMLEKVHEERIRNQRNNDDIKVDNIGSNIKHYTLLMPHAKQKQEMKVRNYFKVLGCYVPLVNRTDDVYTFLENHGAVRLS